MQCYLEGEALPRCIPIALGPLDKYRGSGQHVASISLHHVFTEPEPVKKEKKKPGRKKKVLPKLSIDNRGITLTFD
jgi:hypothetical protein